MVGILDRFFNRRKTISVECMWDQDAGVWYVANSSLDGLCADAETLDQLINKLKPMIHDLLDLTHESGSSHNSGESEFNLLLPNISQQGHYNHC